MFDIVLNLLWGVSAPPPPPPTIIVMPLEGYGLWARLVPVHNRGDSVTRILTHEFFPCSVPDQ
jgi:hypothetical protein